MVNRNSNRQHVKATTVNGIEPAVEAIEPLLSHRADSSQYGSKKRCFANTAALRCWLVSLHSLALPAVWQAPEQARLTHIEAKMPS